ncbi:uncharacterized protein IL334_002438 [Kwoniella shivajii]|uniref:Glycogen storage control protein n=1 Tax=Kwoniella shivajii TaxID=564305 RepID=A0ABZ1CWF2_9TREE|nr:hypothetical protein IL334_002438 [Kwoniella shivajii]
MNGSTENEAGPSRSHSHLPQRRPSDSHAQQSSQDPSSFSRRQSSSTRADATESSNLERSTIPTTSAFSPASSSTKKSKSKTKTETKTEEGSELDYQTPHLDIATYPTQHLLRLLAELLQHIATSNDSLRHDHDTDIGEDGETPLQEDESGDTSHVSHSGSHSGSRSRSHSRTSSLHQSSLSSQPSSSPTTALFDQPKSHNQQTSSQLSKDDIPSSSTISTSTSVSDSNEFPLFTASKLSLSHPSSLLAFHARHIPSISIEAYLLRILKYCPTTNEVFLGLLVYFDRMTRLGTPQGVGGVNAIIAGVSGGNDKSNGGKGKSFAIDSYNVHRLVIAGVTVASKFFSDVFYTNSRYAKVGGLPPTELNSLELQFLLLNDFRLRISLEEMQKYGDRLLAYAAEEEEKHRLEAEIERQRMEKSSIHNDLSEEQAYTTSTSTSTSEYSPSDPTNSQSNSTGQINNDDPNHEIHQDQINSSENAAITHSEKSTPIPTASKSHDTSQVESTTDHPVSNPTSIPPTKAKEGGKSGTTEAPVSGGIRDWVRGEEVMGRMASPMRD